MIRGYEFIDIAKDGYPTICPFCDEPTELLEYQDGIKLICRPCDFSSKNKLRYNEVSHKTKVRLKVIK